MAFVDFKFFSESLGMSSEAYVVIPQRKTSGQIGIGEGAVDGKYKCLYLLHGLSDDHTIWMRRTSIERYAAEYGICVVMPSGGRSFYSNMKYGMRYYDYVAKELPEIICDFFNVSDKREDNFIAGLSMGGYGALKIGMRECHRFSAAAGLSSVADIRERKRRNFDDTLKTVYGEELNIPDEDDLFCLAEITDKNPNKPRIFMIEGDKDFMYEDNIRLKEKFESLDFDYSYKEAPGAHEWGFWDKHIKDVLEWMLKK